MQQDLGKGVKVPPELHSVQPRPLEEYVRARLLQFAHVLASRISPQLNPQLVQTAAFDAIQSLPPPDYGGMALESRDLQLVFRHDCLSLGCLDAQCVLCEHNPHRRCSVNFAAKYLVNDVLKAKCDAPIRVEVIDRATGQPVTEDLPDVSLEMVILDGNSYDTRVVEAGEERDEDLDACALLLNNKGTPLLVSGAGGTHNSQSKVVVPLNKGVAILPDLHVSDSSEALLSGRKPPFRLLVRAVHSGGRRLSVRHCVSEGFVVATRRTRTAGKVEIPNVDDHVSKLEHMGKETVKKLQDIRGSAQQAGIDISVPDNTINKVGEFRKLALLAEADGHLRQKLQQVLKLSKEKWDEARDHALKAVVADNRMRIWYADKQNMEVGLLFTCRLGNVDLERPVGLLTKKSQEGAQTTMEATLMAQQTPAQRDQVRQLQPQAVAAWWQPGHPGWAIYPVDSEQFMSTGALDSVSLPTPDHLHSASPMVPPSPAALPVVPPPGSPGPLSPAPFGTALASAFGLGMPPQGPGDAMLRALTPFMPAGPGMSTNPFLAAQQLAAVQQAQQAQQPMSPMGPGSMHLPPIATVAGTSQYHSGHGAMQSLEAASPRVQGGMAPPSPLAQPNGTSMSLPAVQAMPSVTTPFSNPTAGPPIAPPPPLGINPMGKQNMAPPAMDTAFNFGHLSSLFGADLGRFPQLATHLAAFPSIPQGGLSADLEQLLQQHAAVTAAAVSGGDGAAGGGTDRAHSFHMPKIESMELPGGDHISEALRDLNPDSLHKALGMHGMHALRGHSVGLETMQSIENALDDLEEREEAERAAASQHAQQMVQQQQQQDEERAEERRRLQLAGSKRK